MSSLHHLASVRRGARRHPVVLATGAATAGVLLGAFVMAEVFAPVKPGNADAQVAVASTVAPARTVETTGAAPAGQTAATVNCDNQTWPYLSQPCAAQLHEKEAKETKEHAPRVVSTDKLDTATVNAMQAQPLQQQPLGATSPQPSPAPAIAAVTPQPDAAAAKPAPAIASVTETNPAFAPPEHPSTFAPAAAAKADEASKPGDKAEAAKAEPAHNAKRVAKKAKRKAAPVARPDNDDDSDVAVIDRRDAEIARQDAYDQEYGDGVRVRYPGRRPYVVQRWAGRVPYDEDGGERRVIVHRGGVFEQLFGMGDGDDD